MTTLFEKRSRRSALVADAVYLSEIAPPTHEQCIYYDAHNEAPKGFALRITRKGARAFILRYKVDGRERRMTIGEYPTWSLAAARARAVEVRRDIDLGVDPLATKRERQEAPTVKEAVQRYTQAHLDGLRSADDAKRYFEKDILPELGSRKVADVRRADVVELVERKALTAPRAARALLAHLKHFLAWCELREIIELSPAHGIKPAAVDRSMKPNKRGRVLDDAEVRAFWNATETCGMHKLTALALKFVLLTGQRPGEVAGLPMGEIEGSDWTIPASRHKTAEDHAVPLTDTALTLLEDAKVEVARLARRRGKEPTGFVFEMKGGEPVTVRALSRAVARFRAKVGNRKHPTFGYWTPHDLRRTARTGLAAAGVIQEIAERVVGHMQTGIIAVYDRHRYDDEKRVALEAWECRLLRIVGDDTGATTDTAEPPLVPATVEGVS